ncbi:MAG: biopolymer transporter ExbD [Candidatus Schekmanbacteria bacterium]|nr:biopolymer transporter ExbD [Candidatus Schekmanbacteria bacterium]
MGSFLTNNPYRRSSGQKQFNLPSLVDVVFLLLIFFILTTTFTQVLTKLDVELPKAQAVTEAKTQDTVIEIGKDGQFAYNGEIVTVQELDKQLAQLAVNSPDEVIIIRGDKEVAYGQIVKVMGLCKSHQLGRLAMAAVQEDGAASE